MVYFIEDEEKKIEKEGRGRVRQKERATEEREGAREIVQRRQ